MMARRFCASVRVRFYPGIAVLPRIEGVGWCSGLLPCPDRIASRETAGGRVSGYTVHPCQLTGCACRDGRIPK